MTTIATMTTSRHRAKAKAVGTPEPENRARRDWVQRRSPKMSDSVLRNRTARHQKIDPRLPGTTLISGDVCVPVDDDHRITRLRMVAKLDRVNGLAL